MEVLYWKHVREQLETLRKLQRREASTGHWPPGPGWGEAAAAHTFSAQAAKRWLPRPEEELWPVEEDRLEDSLEELGEAGGCSQGGGKKGAQDWLPAHLPVPPHLPADDFLEPEGYAEPDRAKPEDAADLGRSRAGAGQVLVRLPKDGRGGGRVWPTPPAALLLQKQRPCRHP